ncbi:hypothetical protein ABB37_09874 [Leptomonas pyrrhocoris]|uniref:Uncharacterized protein n=1 Tax=Leptomonas pyrrhocoris TaxID=157538 RepID=A0A0M9FPH9_LEPPY|nr:hypothetical protein ABB37_09874 [Leptomonas pyrrhocoris]KPA73430.1 hypothetical protein ABB37_09874 [Leptomonas pyrrhocoris]|eukprot:XP_015651869.1 hypothetical protein ABB37_09874 [Leptomonas pyrrhocoris]
MPSPVARAADSCHVSDPRSGCGGVASPVSASWRSSDTEKESSLSVPFLHLWLPPRQPQQGDRVAAKASSLAGRARRAPTPPPPPRTTAAAAVAVAVAARTPARIIRKQHPRSATGRADRYTSSSSSGGGGGGVAQAVRITRHEARHHHHRTNDDGAYPRGAPSVDAAHRCAAPRTSARAVLGELDASLSLCSADFFVRRTALPPPASADDPSAGRDVSAAAHRASLSLSSSSLPSSADAASLSLRSTSVHTCGSTPRTAQQAAVAEGAEGTPLPVPPHPHDAATPFTSMLCTAAGTPVSSDGKPKETTRAKTEEKRRSPLPRRREAVPASSPTTTTAVESTGGGACPLSAWTPPQRCDSPTALFFPARRGSTGEPPRGRRTSCISLLANAVAAMNTTITSAAAGAAATPLSVSARSRRSRDTHSSNVLVMAAAHSCGVLCPALHDSDGGSRNDPTSVGAVNLPMLPSTSAVLPGRKGGGGAGGRPYAEGALCAPLAAMADIGVLLCSCSSSPSRGSLSSISSRGATGCDDALSSSPEVREENGNGDDGEAQTQARIRPHAPPPPPPPQLPPLPSPPDANVEALRRRSSVLHTCNRSNQLNGEEKRLMKVPHARSAPATTHSGNDRGSDDDDDSSSERQGSVSARQQPPVNLTTAVKSAHRSKRKDNGVSRPYAQPLSTPLTSLRYHHRLREEELAELAELQACLAAFVFPPRTARATLSRTDASSTRPTPSATAANIKSDSNRSSCRTNNKRGSQCGLLSPSTSNSPLPRPPPSRSTPAVRARYSRRHTKRSPER